MKIPFFSFSQTNLQIKTEIMDVFEHFFDSEYYVLGKSVEEFETSYAQLTQTNFCVGVANGLDALHIALKSLGIQDGDEVIVPSNTYIATVLAISFTGAKPVFVEPSIKTYNLDPNLIEKSITSKTKAILPVHLYGQACEMELMMDLAKKYSLFVVEDNAQGHLATHKSQFTGSFGDINATSFYPTKNLGALGDAGAITTNNGELAQKSKVMRNYGSQKRYYNEVIGLNSRLDEIQAAFLNVKLKYLSEWTSQRQQIAEIYNTKLQEIGDIILPFTAADCTHVYHLYVIRTNKRDELQSYLQQKGIGTIIHYPIPAHLQQAYQSLGYKQGDFPIAEQIADTCLSLPLYIGLQESQIEYICTTIKEFFS